MKRALQRIVLFATAAFGGWWGTGAFLPAEGRTAKRSPLIPLNDGAGISGGQRLGIAARLTALRRPGSGGEEMLAACALAQEISPLEFAAYLNEARHLPANAAGDIFRNLIVQRWLSLDPAGAMTWCRRNDTALAAAALTAWTRADAVAAGSYVLSLPPREQNLATVAAVLAETDFSKAIDFLCKAPNGSTQGLDTVFDKLAAKDQQWLLDNAGKLPRYTAMRARMSAVKAWATSDFSGAVKWWQSQPDREDLIGGVKAAAPAPDKLLEAWAGLSPLARNELMVSQIFTWGKDNPEAFLKAAADLDTLKISVSEWEELLKPAVDSLADGGFEKALPVLQQFLADHPDWWARRFAGRWSGTDREAARNWVASLQDSSLSKSCLDAISEITGLIDYYGPRLPRLQTYVRFEAEGAAVLRDLTPGEVSSILSERAKSDDGLDPVKQEMTRLYPAGYAQWLQDSGQPVEAFASEWASEDPAAAAAWVLSRPDSEERTQMLKVINGTGAGRERATVK
jgi:hypothetical protein